MGEELVERLTRECGITRTVHTVGGVEVGLYMVSDMKMLTLVQRVAEECAQRCDEVAAHDLSLMSPQQAVEHVAAAIRAKFKGPT